MRVQAEAKSGQKTPEEAGSVGILVQYKGDNRYPTDKRDEKEGGDDWVKPSVLNFANNTLSSWKIGDISNMNGGKFIGHDEHRAGGDIDAWFSGYNARNAATATTIINYLNNPTVGKRVSAVGVTFTDAFKDAIQNVTLVDGRLATTVFRDWADHDTHLHLRVVAGGAGTDEELKVNTLALLRELNAQSKKAITVESNLQVPLRPNPAVLLGNGLAVNLYLPAAGRLKVDLLDETGGFVRQLIDKVSDSGEIKLNWNGKDHKGNYVRPGTFYVKVQAPKCDAQIRRVVVTQ